MGFQEDIIQQLYELIKHNHGYEDDWGMVIEQLNEDITNGEDSSLSKNSSKNLRDGGYQPMN